jgi:hypothetical protein
LQGYQIAGNPLSFNYRGYYENNTAADGVTAIGMIWILVSISGKNVKDWAIRSQAFLL